MLPVIALVVVATGCTGRPARRAGDGATGGRDTPVSTIASAIDHNHDHHPDDEQQHDDEQHQHDDDEHDYDDTTSTPPPRPPRRRQRRHDDHAASRRPVRLHAAGQAPSTWEVRPPSDIPSPEVPAGWTTTIAGRTVQGRDIDVFVRAVDAPRRRVLVIGGIARQRAGHSTSGAWTPEAAIAPDVEVWLVPSPTRTARRPACGATPTGSI